MTTTSKATHTAEKWEFHCGIDYAVVMLPGECTENASISVSGERSAELVQKVIAIPEMLEALEAAESSINRLLSNVYVMGKDGFRCKTCNRVMPLNPGRSSFRLNHDEDCQIKAEISVLRHVGEIISKARGGM